MHTVGQIASYFTMGAIAVSAAYLALIYWLPGADWFVAAHVALHAASLWVWKNLNFSLPIFLLVALYFQHVLLHLKLELAGETPDPVAVAKREQDVQLATQLMVGVGVIFTAIGMRGALVYALSDPAVPEAEGAFGILKRLVDGGILIALSTTIFGSVAGYVMRVLASVQTAADLNRFYERAQVLEQGALLAGLERIERQLIALNASNGHRPIPVE